jgi:hypothetical protein
MPLSSSFAWRADASVFADVTARASPPGFANYRPSKRPLVCTSDRVNHFQEVIMAVSEMNERASARAGEPWQHSEGAVARGIEQQTAKLPSDTFLWIAVAAMTGSAMLQISGRKPESLFVGQWVAPFLLFGIYNKLVKIAGSDRVHA